MGLQLLLPKINTKINKIWLLILKKQLINKIKIKEGIFSDQLLHFPNCPSDLILNEKKKKKYDIF